MTPKRYIVALLFVPLLGTACVTTSKGPGPPDFSQQSAQVASSVEDLDRARVTIERDIRILREASGNLFDSDASLYFSPFPLDLFRHAAMACLNTPLEPRIDAPPRYQEAARAAGVTCPVAPIGPLLDALSETNSDRKEALRRLGLVDEWRRTRSRMRDRLRQLPRILEQTREWIASQRAAARQTEIELERRRAEYSKDRFDAAKDAIEKHRQQLTDLEERVAEVEGAIPAWTRAVGAEIDYVYSRLSLLGPT